MTIGLTIERYPSKATWNAEATRTDTPSYPYLHVDFLCKGATTINLFNELHNDPIFWDVPASGVELNVEAIGSLHQISLWIDDISREKYKEKIRQARTLLRRIARKNYRAFYEQRGLYNLKMAVRIEFHD